MAETTLMFGGTTAICGGGGPHMILAGKTHFLPFAPHEEPVPPKLECTPGARREWLDLPKACVEAAIQLPSHLHDQLSGSHDLPTTPLRTGFRKA